jgi:hypothetical protein
MSSAFQAIAERQLPILKLTTATTGPQGSRRHAMNAQSHFSVAQKRLALKAAALGLALSLIGRPVGLALRSAEAAAPDQDNLYQLAMTGQGSAAVQQVANAAREWGNWQPAPGNKVVFDSSLAWNVRGEVMIRDLVPEECQVPKMARMMAEDCATDLVTKQDLVRFGKSMFYERQPDGSTLPRPVFDDVLSTYIEEVGHSWQEYLFETEGRGSGARTHLTRWDEAARWGHGWEYQIKMYILNLDGTLLNLSDLEYGRLKANICDADGYANPLGRDIPTFGAPAGWPQPESWPVAAPTPEQFETFCAGTGF